MEESSLRPRDTPAKRLEPALVSRLAGVPIRIGYGTQGRSFLLTNPLPLPEWRNRQHESFYYLNVVAAIAQMVGGLAGESANVLELQPEFDPPSLISEG